MVTTTIRTSDQVVEDERQILVLEDELAEVAGQLNLVNSRLVELMQRALATDAWRGDRILSPAHWLAWRAGLSLKRAGQVVQIAERRDEFPRVIAAFDRGEIAVEQVAAVTDAAPEWADGLVLDFARAATVSQLKRMIRKQNFDHDHEVEPAPKPAPERVSTGHVEDGRWRMSADLHTDHGELFDQALREAKDALFNAGQTDATMVDALMEICRRSLSAIGSVSRHDRYRLWWHLDANANASTTQGWQLPSALRDRLLCDGVVNPVWEQNGLPVNIGRAQHIVPNRTRVVVVRRDGGCRVPGCECTTIEVHHIIHWKDGGVTETYNLISLCPRHHRLHHLGLLGIVGNADQPDGVVFTDARGRRLEASGTPTPPTQPPPTPEIQYVHPDGGRLDRNWVGLGWISPTKLARIREQNRQNWLN